MLITRTSQATGVTRTLDLPVTPEQVAAFESGSGLIQDIFPDLSSSDREFILSGMTEQEWSDIFDEYERYHYEADTGSEFDDIAF